MCHNQPFKALHDYTYECYMAVVNGADSLRVIGKRNDGGQLVWINKLGQGEVGNDREYASQPV